MTKSVTWNVASLLAASVFAVGAAHPALSQNATTLVVAEDVVPQTSDPTQSSQIRTWYAWQLVYEGLVRAELDGSVVPVVASEWTVSADGTVYEFTLRDGITFSNGSPVTADDVVHSFERPAENGLPYARAS